MIWDFIEAFTNVRTKQKLFADDNVAKLNRITTVSLLIIVALFMTAKSYTADQIQCNGDKNIISLSQDYVNSICWVKDIYQPENFYDQHPSAGKRFNFYPWLPVITLILGFCFYFPYLIWKSILRNSMYQHMPIDINEVVSLLNQSNILDKQKFNQSIESASTYLDKCFSLNNFYDSFEDEFEDQDYFLNNNKKLLNKESKSLKHRIQARKFFIPLIFSYLFVKLIYLAVSIGIFALIDLIFRFEYSFYWFGYESLSSMFFEQKESYDDLSYLRATYFPRVVICNIHTKEDMGQTITETPFQCVLSSNFLNEKLFIVLWLWFCLMVMLNFISFIKWIYIFIARKSFIEEMLKWPYNYDYDIQLYIKPFVEKYLRSEGFLVLMLIKSNTQDWHCRMIINLLWKRYIKRCLESENFYDKKQSPDQNSDIEYDFNKTPISNETYKFQNRRQLNISEEEPSTFIKMTPENKNCKNVLFNVSNNQ